MVGYLSGMHKSLEFQALQVLALPKPIILSGDIGWSSSYLAPHARGQASVSAPMWVLSCSVRAELGHRRDESCSSQFVDISFESYKCLKA